MRVLTNAVGNVPMNPKSHVHGWAQVWAELLSLEIDHRFERVTSSDEIYVDHGANYSGSVNLFGGVTDEIHRRLTALAESDEVVSSLDWDMPDYGALFKKRIGNASTSPLVTEMWCDWISENIESVTLRMQDLTRSERCRGVTIGDSHSVAFSAPGDVVFKNDGKTLNGALTEGLDSFTRGANLSGKEVTLSFGSIDIRHHFSRLGINIPDLVKEYVDAGDRLAEEHDCTVTFAVPVPVEYEGRKIPKTGYYKGEPFYGSLEDRQKATTEFIEALGENVPIERLVIPPANWYTMDPEAYAKEIMETGGSFHIAPPFYRRNNWGLAS